MCQHKNFSCLVGTCSIVTDYIISNFLLQTNLSTKKKILLHRRNVIILYKTLKPTKWYIQRKNEVGFQIGHFTRYDDPNDPWFSLDNMKKREIKYYKPKLLYELD
jgi:hypothetical protein